MKFAGPLKHLTLAFAIALAGYALFYYGIEQRRTRNGPWQVTFTSVSNSPTLIINEAKLNISNLRISFPDHTAGPTNFVMVGDQPREVPFDVPFGTCVFMDTTFQPGTIAFKFFDHVVQLMPRVLTIDKVEHPWQSDTTIKVGP
jgi:hypothetical protein